MIFQDWDRLENSLKLAYDLYTTHKEVTVTLILNIRLTCFVIFYYSNTTKILRKQHANPDTA